MKNRVKVVISGNIGVGKTTLCNNLERAFQGIKVLNENFEEN